MDQAIIDLYDDYVHRHFDRRLFLDRLSKHVGGMSAALAVLPLLQSNYALAATVAEDDARIRTRRVSFLGASGTLNAYLAEPKAGESRLHRLEYAIAPRSWKEGEPTERFYSSKPPLLPTLMAGVLWPVRKAVGVPLDKVV